MNKAHSACCDADASKCAQFKNHLQIKIKELKKKGKGQA